MPTRTDVFYHSVWVLPYSYAYRNTFKLSINVALRLLYFDPFLAQEHLMMSVCTIVSYIAILLAKDFETLKNIGSLS